MKSENSIVVSRQLSLGHPDDLSGLSPKQGRYSNLNACAARVQAIRNTALFLLVATITAIAIPFFIAHALLVAPVAFPIYIAIGLILLSSLISIPTTHAMTNLFMTSSKNKRPHPSYQALSQQETVDQPNEGKKRKKFFGKKKLPPKPTIQKIQRQVVKSDPDKIASEEVEKFENFIRSYLLEVYNTKLDHKAFGLPEFIIGGKVRNLNLIKTSAEHLIEEMYRTAIQPVYKLKLNKPKITALIDLICNYIVIKHLLNTNGSGSDSDADSNLYIGYYKKLDSEKIDSFVKDCSLIFKQNYQKNADEIVQKKRDLSSLVENLFSKENDAINFVNEEQKQSIFQKMNDLFFPSKKEEVIVESSNKFFQTYDDDFAS